MNTIKYILDVITPRFITEKVALVYDEELGLFEPICTFDDLEDGEHVDASCVMRSFNLFGFAIRPKFVEGSFVAISNTAKIEYTKIQGE